jgi:hypothetical protein
MIVHQVAEVVEREVPSLAANRVQVKALVNEVNAVLQTLALVSF